MEKRRCGVAGDLTHIFSKSTISLNESEKEDNSECIFFESVKVAPLGRFFLIFNNLER